MLFLESRQIEMTQVGARSAEKKESSEIGETPTNRTASCEIIRLEGHPPWAQKADRHRIPTVIGSPLSPPNRSYRVRGNSYRRADNTWRITTAAP